MKLNPQDLEKISGKADIGQPLPTSIYQYAASPTPRRSTGREARVRYIHVAFVIEDRQPKARHLFSCSFCGGAIWIALKVGL